MSSMHREQFAELDQVWATRCTKSDMTLGNGLHKIGSNFGQHVAQSRIELWAGSDVYDDVSRHLPKLARHQPLKGITACRMPHSRKKSDVQMWSSRLVPPLAKKPHSEGTGQNEYQSDPFLLRA